MDTNRIVKSIVKAGIILTIFYFLGKNLYQNWNQIDLKQLHFDIPLFIISIFFLFGHFLLAAFGWKLILKELGVSLSFVKGLKIFFYSQLGKYLPGKIWTFAGRMYFCQKIGIPTNKTFLSMVLELALMTISGVLIFLISVLFSASFRMNVNPFLLLTIVVLILTAIHAKIMVRIINFFLGLLKKEAIKLEVKFSQISSIMLLYFIIWFCFGIAFYFLINSVTFVPACKIPIITGSFAISSTIGVVALFAPAGLGVREGILDLSKNELYTERFSNLQANVGLFQLEETEAVLEKRKKIADLYFKELWSLESLQLLKWPSYIEPSLMRFPIRVTKGNKFDFYWKCVRKGLDLAFGYSYSCAAPQEKEEYPNSFLAARQVLDLPFNSRLLPEEVERIVSIVKSISRNL